MKTLTKEYKISTVGEDDYPELEGKTVTFFPIDNYIPAIPCVVVGCNRSVGVTLVSADTKEYIMCFRGPVCPGTHYESPEDVLEGNELFDAIVEGIIEGEVYAEILTEIVESHGAVPGHSVGSHSCAYNQ